MTGEEIKSARLERKLSMRKLARILSVNVSTVSRWENGDTEKMSPVTARRLQRFFYEDNIDIPLEADAIAIAYQKANAKTKKIIRILLNLE